VAEGRGGVGLQDPHVVHPDVLGLRRRRQGGHRHTPHTHSRRRPTPRHPRPSTGTRPTIPVLARQRTHVGVCAEPCTPQNRESCWRETTRRGKVSFWRVRGGGNTAHGAGHGACVSESWPGGRVAILGVGPVGPIGPVLGPGVVEEGRRDGRVAGRAGPRLWSNRVGQPPPLQTVMKPFEQRTIATPPPLNTSDAQSRLGMLASIGLGCGGVGMLGLGWHVGVPGRAGWHVCIHGTRRPRQTHYHMGVG